MPESTESINMGEKITVEEVDTRWPYRAGYPRLLRPSVKSLLILNKNACPIIEAKFEELMTHINMILDAYNILCKPDPITVRYRAQKYRSSMLPRIIVNCIYNKETSNSQIWAKAVPEIYAAARLATKWGREIGVELLDWEYESTSHICPPPDSDARELKANWDKGHRYHRQILQLFENRPPMFRAMIPIGRCAAGPLAYEWTMVILFDAINAEDVAWDSLEERMRSFLPANVDVEIRQQATSLFCNDYVEAVGYGQSIVDRDARPPRPGCEISQRNKSSDGTMGITEVTDSKQRTAFGIAYAHVALANKKPQEICWPEKDNHLPIPSDTTCNLLEVD